MSVFEVMESQICSRLTWQKGSFLEASVPGGVDEGAVVMGKVSSHLPILPLKALR